jgi:glutathione synthase
VRLLMVVDRLATEDPRTTSLLLARAAVRRGHEVFLLEVDRLGVLADGAVGGVAYEAAAAPLDDHEAFLAALLEAGPRREVTTAEVELLWLRYNPSQYLPGEAWLAAAGMHFGQLAVRRGTPVLDDPEALLWAEGKLYLEHFPAELRPRTVVTRSAEAVRRFHAASPGGIVLKPLTGYGGRDVFLVRDDATNLTTIVGSLAREGWVVAQEYLPAAEAGDVRLLVMNGLPLEVDGRWAAVRRTAAAGDFRSNMMAGGDVERVQVDAVLRRIVATVGPRLTADGIFLAGLDVVGDRLVEINTVSPGGLFSAERLEGVDFGGAVIHAVERKVERHRRGGLTNRELAGTG